MIPGRIRGRRRPCLQRAMVVSLLLAVVLVGGCRGEEVPPDLQPDAVLRRELGLTDADRVHRVLLTSAERERLTPDSVVLPRGAWVEFVTGDWRLHEVRFVMDSLRAAGRAFLESTDQAASPPLVDRDARFVVFFGDAPTGRYPFVVEGNGRPAHGVVVVVPKP